eukprot:15218504-Heterocapsa_arctica.AAC.1
MGEQTASSLSKARCYPTQSDTRLIMLDSGAFTHVCLVGFAPEVPVDCSTPGQGKTVRLRTWGGTLIDVKFAVMDVARPLLSVGQLQRKGWDSHFGN